MTTPVTTTKRTRFQATLWIQAKESRAWTQVSPRDKRRNWLTTANPAQKTTLCVSLDRVFLPIASPRAISVANAGRATHSLLIRIRSSDSGTDTRFPWTLASTPDTHNNHRVVCAKKAPQEVATRSPK